MSIWADQYPDMAEGIDAKHKANDIAEAVAVPSVSGPQPDGLQMDLDSDSEENIHRRSSPVPREWRYGGYA